MYDFVTHTWNPLAGKCSHDCIYCSTKRLMLAYPVLKVKYNGMPRTEPSCLRDFLGIDNVIFVCAQNDLFTEDVNPDDIEDILKVCRNFPLNRYLFQSKNPNRFLEFHSQYPKNSIFGTTIETNRDMAGISKAPGVAERVIAMGKLAGRNYSTMITIEPILKFDLAELTDLIDWCEPEWVNIGADSKNYRLNEPDPGEVEALIKALQVKYKVIVKDNLGRLKNKGVS